MYKYSGDKFLEEGICTEKGEHGDPMSEILKRVAVESLGLRQRGGDSVRGSNFAAGNEEGKSGPRGGEDGQR